MNYIPHIQIFQYVKEFDGITKESQSHILTERSTIIVASLEFKKTALLYTLIYEIFLPLILEA